MQGGTMRQNMATEAYVASWRLQAAARKFFQKPGSGRPMRFVLGIVTAAQARCEEQSAQDSRANREVGVAADTPKRGTSLAHRFRDDLVPLLGRGRLLLRRIPSLRSARLHGVKRRGEELLAVAVAFPP